MLAYIKLFQNTIKFGFKHECPTKHINLTKKGCDF